MALAFVLDGGPSFLPGRFTLFAGIICFCSRRRSNNENWSSFRLIAPTSHAWPIVSQDSDDVSIVLQIASAGFE